MKPIQTAYTRLIWAAVNALDWLATFLQDGLANALLDLPGRLPLEELPTKQLRRIDE